MRKIVSLLIGLAGLFGMLSVAAAAPSHTPDQVKAFVHKAMAYMKSEGNEKAFAAFSDPKGAFVDGELYLVVMNATDGQMTMLAHGAVKALIGKPQIDTKDAEGKAFNREVPAKLVKDGDEIWLDFMWPNPATKKLGKKHMYFTRVGGVFIGAGLYE